MIDPVVLNRLLTADGPVPTHALGITRDDLAALEAAGCRLDDHPQHGLRLLSAGLGCWVDYIEQRHADRLGRRMLVFRETTSTQDVARQAQVDDGTVITTDHQTGGRGRLGRRWVAPAGAALLMTAVVRHTESTPVDRLMLAAACAVAEAVESLCEQQVQIRWPNDVLLNGRKLAGILVETANNLAMIGIGLNVSAHPADLNATSLRAESIHVDRLHLLDVLLDRLDFDVRHATDAQLLRCWRARSCLTGQRVTVSVDSRQLTGRVIDLDPAHGLLMQIEQGPITTLPAATTSLVV